MTNVQSILWSELYARAQSRLKPSAIREILKITRRPGIISFAGGVPDPNLFPFKQLQSCINSVLKEDARNAFQYGVTQGCDELLQEISTLVTSLERPTSAENILVTNGSQQGLDLIARLFLNEGDAVAVTRPCYLGALQAFMPMNPSFHEVRCDDNGPILEDLKKALPFKPKFFYLVPAFQNPTGQSVSVERADEILSLCRDARVPIVEDGAYEGLYYENRQRSFRTLEAEYLEKNKLSYNEGGSIIFLGTFSKVIAPGFRIGWVEAPDPVLKALVVLKQGADLHTSTFNQLVVARFIKEHAQQYWLSLRKAYARKRDVMLGLVDSLLSQELSYYSKPSGGLFVWLEANRALDFAVLLNEAVEKDSIAYVPGAPFYANDPRNNTIRISFATASEEDMKVGITKLLRLIQRS